MIVDAIVQNPDCNIVCIREIQKSLKFSAKKLIEDKIYSMGYGHLFDIQATEIRRKGGKGIIIFMGMQDHTADSIKSLEGFDIAWVEEAQSLSKKSLDMLLPTIRKELEDGSEGSELWFTWNPYLESDAVDQLWKSVEKSEDAIWAHVNYLDNPFCPKILHKEAERCRIHDAENYPNIWLGEYLTRTDDQIFGGKWEYADYDEEVENGEWDGPYHGLDFGFAEDPSAAVKVWRKALITFTFNVRLVVSTLRTQT
jgi:phage terminase large subunit